MNNGNTSSSPAPLGNSAQQSLPMAIFHFFTRTMFGRILLAVVVIGLVLLCYYGWTIDIPGGGGLRPPSSHKETPLLPSASDQLDAFDKEVDEYAKSVCRLFIEEEAKQGQETQYTRTLLYVHVQLSDIRTVRIDEIRGTCKGDPRCVADEIALKRDYIKTELAKKYRIPLFDYHTKKINKK